MKPDRDRFLTRDDFRKLLQAAKQSRNPERDYMLFCLAGNLGLRVSEAVGLRLGDFHFRGQEPFLRIRTAKQRVETLDDLPLHPTLERAAKLYLVDLGRRARLRFPGVAGKVLVRGRSSLCLFPSETSSFRPLTTRAAEKAFDAAAARAGLRPGFSFHALRHYRGVRVYAETRDVLVVKRLLRHRSLHSSFLYMHLDPETSSALNSRVGSVT